MRFVRVVAPLLLVAITAAGGEHLQCGTSERTNEQVRQLDAWSTAREQMLLSKGARIAPNATVQSNIVVLPADEVNAPFRHPFDLGGRSLMMQRSGTQSFNVTNAALAYDDDRGMEVTLPAGKSYVEIPLTLFHFPFFDRDATTLFVSEYNGIYLDPPDEYGIGQYGDVELVAQRQAVIAPLLTTNESQFGQVPKIYVKQSGEAITVTWTTTGTRLNYDVQAQLSRTGDIRFSYRGTEAVISGSVIVTSGHEPWRSQLTTLASIGDVANDVSTRIPTAAQAMLDIDTTTISRVADSDVLEARIKMRAAIDPKLIGGASDYAAFYVTIGNAQSSFYLYGDGSSEYYTGAWGGGMSSPGARVEGDTIVMTIMQSLIVPWSGKLVPRSVTYLSSVATTADQSIFELTADAPRSARSIDFSAAARTIDGPLYEAFTIPIVSTRGAWNEVKDLYRLQDGAFDAVAIYQNFYTDLIFYAGAYSSGGNAQVEGITASTSITPNAPRTPALMHMNRIGYSWNATPNNAGHVVMHELGHRWLYYFSIMENGQKKFALNPLRQHPAQFVDTRAAFSVRTDHDASVMGGGLFTESAGSFASTEFANFGYSWLDLYLMGLADKAEVQPLYYIANSNPRLGDAYYPPPSRTFQGERRDVVIQQVIDAMGTRKPAYPNTQRTFRTLFVLLADPDRPITEEEIAAVDGYRETLREKFPIATGGRASVVTDFDGLTPPRRRTVGR
ncbi:MAG: hypothetical protein QOI24_2362 [Acidobacteriota bacterium]|jgi:hypothetical protein|nr:hypothetical protein [Acidobacteriota bacterium]